MERIAIGGSAANPPHLGHVLLLSHLLECGKFTKVIWVISGDRDDKQYDVTPDDRVAMTEMTVGQLRLKSEINCQLIIRYNDVYYKNTPTYTWIENLKKEFPGAEITWYTGSDSIVPIYDGKSEIETKWYRGKELLENEKFFIFPRDGFKLTDVFDYNEKLDKVPDYMPKDVTVYGVELPDFRSSEIRTLIKESKNFEHLLMPSVVNYIATHKLYGYKGEI